MGYVYVLDNNKPYSDHVTLVFEDEAYLFDDFRALFAELSRIEREERGNDYEPLERWSVDWVVEARALLLRPAESYGALACFFEDFFFYQALCDDPQALLIPFARTLPRLGPKVLQWEQQKAIEAARRREEAAARLAARLDATPAHVRAQFPLGIFCNSCGGVFKFPPDSNTGTCACGATCEVAPGHLTWSAAKTSLTAMPDGSTRCSSCARVFDDLRAAIDHDCDGIPF